MTIQRCPWGEGGRDPPVGRVGGSPPPTAGKVDFPQCTIIIVNDSRMTYLILLIKDPNNPWCMHLLVDDYYNKRITVSFANPTIF